MATSRREFLAYAAGVGGLVGLPGPLLGRLRGRLGAITPAPRRLRMLLLDGEDFLGPQQVAYALARGHAPTLFHGDRSDALAATRRRVWDAVIDNRGALPTEVAPSGGLADAAGHYLFISASSVADAGRTAAIADTERAFPARTTIVRPGLVVGPGDPSDHLAYWLARIERGGEVLAPGRPTDPVQIIDVRDLGAWTVRLAEERRFGVFDTLGPRAPHSCASLLGDLRAVTRTDASFTWVDRGFLAEHRVRPPSDLPASALRRCGAQNPGGAGSGDAIAARLTFRPWAETARDTLAWFKSQPPARQARAAAGLSAEREAGILAAWHARGG